MSANEFPFSLELQCPSPYLGGPQLSDVCVGGSGVLFLMLINNIFALHPKIGDPCGRVKPVKKPDLHYDFIVVGGGASGPIVAARLSEVENWKVLLVEAGPDEPAGTQVPSYLQLFLNSELDWKFKTTNESNACLSTGGRCSWPRGKNLGGCTSHHGMAYHRGHKKDYDRWVEMGNAGWSWKEVLPYFFKSEDNREIGRVSSRHHGVGGPLTVERFPWQPQFAWDIMTGASETKLGVTEDLVGDQITGFTVAQMISRDGVRLSSSAAYLRPNRDRKNLHVAVNATVTKVTINNNRATGIEYVVNGKKHVAKARREVILAAGTVNSPHLLLLSGVGPKKHLESVGVPVVHDLPGVGENVHNHVSYGVDFTVNEPPLPDVDVVSYDLYAYNQTGPLSSTGLAQVTGVLASSHTTPDDPDIQIFFAGYQEACRSRNAIADLSTYNGHNTVRFTSVNLRPISRGRITLKSADPLEHPIIWSNDLGHPQDVDIIIQGLHAIFTLANSTVMREKHNLAMVPPNIPQCAHLDRTTDAYWSCAIHWRTRTENHQAGSCKMGPASDPLAVVDPTLKVHGIRGLRVADASVMPKVVSGNPAGTIHMIGERVADFIKETWKA